MSLTFITASIYLAVGVGFWLALIAARYDTLKGATAASVARGLLGGVFLWPAMVFVVAKDAHEERWHVEVLVKVAREVVVYNQFGRGMTVMSKVLDGIEEALVPFGHVRYRERRRPYV